MRRSRAGCTVSKASAAPAAGTAYAVGWPAIDAMHAECDALLRDLVGANDAGVAGAVALLHRHLLDHFGLEEALMQASSFPPFDCHKREHDEVLRVVERVRALAAVGDTALPRRFAAEFPSWLAVHAGSMDAMLAAWLLERSRQDGPGAP